ncbi:MAG TPA: TonB family protein [Terriglobales bacterium]|jgi:TonB family protein
MSPRSLFFSSDQETLRQLTHVLEGLEFEVDPCTEIFAAIEKVTTQAYELIVVDWDEGLEASFLLKTSRELKLNHDAVPAAILRNDEAVPIARQGGAAILIKKPIVPEEAKYSFLSSDDFLRGMRSWVPKLNLHPRTSRPVGPQLVLPPVAGAGSADEDHSKQPAERPRTSKTLFHIERKNKQRRGIKSTSGHWFRLILLACTLGIALSSAGYVFSAPLRTQEIAKSVEQIYEKALTKTQNWLDKSAQSGEEGAPKVAQNNLRPNTRTGAKIRVMPVREYVEPTPPPANDEESLSGDNPESSQQYPSVAVASIPDSLRVPSQSIRTASARVTTSLLGGLEPVNVSEDVTQKLLLQKVEPSYPIQAQKVGLRGPVVLQAWIGRDGNIRDLKLIHGSILLGQAAYSAVKQWKYRPYLLNGQAVEMQTYVTVDFALP